MIFTRSEPSGQLKLIHLLATISHDGDDDNVSLDILLAPALCEGDGDDVDVDEAPVAALVLGLLEPVFLLPLLPVGSLPVPRHAVLIAAGGGDDEDGELDVDPVPLNGDDHTGRE